MWWQGVRLPVFMILGVLFASIVLYRVLTGRFARRMRIVQQSMQNIGVSLATPYSSGVSEIDQLCVALSKSQQKLEQATQNREKLLLSAADAGTYAVRVRDSQIIAGDDRFLEMLGKTQTEILNHPWVSLLFDGISGNVEAVSGEYRLHDMVRSILRFKHQNGHPLWLSLAEYHDKVDGEAVR